jgi:hypothetical protein
MGVRSARQAWSGSSQEHGPRPFIAAGRAHRMYASSRISFFTSLQLLM